MDERFKYPRTWHFPWSQGLQNDDRRIPSTGVFHDQRVIVTEKYDGEGTSCYNHTSHARSMDSANHPSRDCVKSFFGTFMHDIPNGWRICGENVYATHSIQYRRDKGNPLPHYFMGFSVWDETNTALNWDDTLVIFETLGITPARVLYDGVYDEALLKQMAEEFDPDLMEGYVVRLAATLPYGHFLHGAAKVVRKGHVQTTEFWRNQEIVPNETISGGS